MTVRDRLKLVLIAALALSAMVFTGCSKNQYAYTYQVNDLDARVSALEGRKTVTTTGTYVSVLGDVPDGYRRTYMALPTGVESTSSMLVEKMFPEKVTAGQTFDYFLRITNLTGGVYMSDVTVRDQISENFSLASSSPAAQVQGDTLVWNLGTLAPEETRTITVTGSASATGESATCASIDWVPTLCLGTVAVQPDLSVTFDGTDWLTACDVATYRATVTNSGTGVAQNVRVMGSLPSGLKTVDGSASLSADLGDMQPGDSRDISFSVQPERAGSYEAMIRVTSDNVATLESSVVNTVVCQPALALEASGTELLYLGNEGFFIASVSNPSDCNVENVEVVATLPACLDVVNVSDNGSATGRTVTWNLGTLAAGASRDVTVRIAGNAKCNDDVNFVVTGVCADRQADSVPVEIAGIPAILLEVIDITDPVKVGQSSTYVITATNQGSEVGTGIKITGSVEGMTITSTSGATTGNVSGNTVNFAPLASLDPGAKAEWRVEIRANEPGDKRFAIEMTSDQFPRPVNETESTYLYE
ncbi:DUF11 domain-containing protein [bacterium]|nr:DUF11 domain-containing protein [bacterium]